MAEPIFQFDEDLLMKTTRAKLAEDLTKTVKEVAKSGEWELTTETEESEPEKIVRRMFANYANGNVPEWFASAVSATSYVLSVDKAKGVECVAALYEATGRAPAELRMTAQTKLLMVCQGIGLFSGLGRLTAM